MYILCAAMQIHVVSSLYTFCMSLQHQYNMCELNSVNTCTHTCTNAWSCDHYSMLQIDMLVPGILGKRDSYGRRYCGGKPLFIARGVYDWRSSSNLAELNAVLQKHLLIRRLKKHVLQDLPAKLRQRVPIEVDPDCVQVSVLVSFQGPQTPSLPV